jgi:glutamate/aspartate transport system substrate-binding protein
MDDILLASLVAGAKTPADYVIGSEAYSIEPYGIMLRREDPAFQKVADSATAQLYKSGAIMPIYEKWFQKPVPPKSINLNLPVSPQLKNEFANPTNSGDPAVYK